MPSLSSNLQNHIFTITPDPRIVKVKVERTMEVSFLSPFFTFLHQVYSPVAVAIQDTDHPLMDIAISALPGFVDMNRLRTELEAIDRGWKFHPNGFVYRVMDTTTRVEQVVIAIMQCKLRNF